jgi:hypothetical protein
MQFCFDANRLAVLEKQKKEIADMKKSHAEAKKAAEKEIQDHQKEIKKKDDAVRVSRLRYMLCRAYCSSPIAPA